MLTELEMACVQFVSVKIMTIAYATVTSQVNEIIVFFPCFRILVLFNVFHIFSWFQMSVKIRFQVSGVRGIIGRHPSTRTRTRTSKMRRIKYRPRPRPREPTDN